MTIELTKIDDFINAINSTFKGSSHIEAYQYLQQGKTDDAIAIWEKYHNENHQDRISAHHLAIIFHSLAFDKEREGNTKEAIPYWKKALNYWYKLYSSSDFWNELTKKMIFIEGFDKGRFRRMRKRLPQEFQNEEKARNVWKDALNHWFEHGETPEFWEQFEAIGLHLGGRRFKVNESLGFQKSLPKNILDVNYKLVLHYNAQKRLDVAHDHMELINQSNFPDEIIWDFKYNIADAFLPDDASVKDGQRFQDAINSSERLLAIDPENIRGLRFILLAYTEWNFALSKDDNLAQIENNMQKIRNGRYIDKLKKSMKDIPEKYIYIRPSVEEEISRANKPILYVYRTRINNLIVKHNTKADSGNRLSNSEAREIKSNLKQYLSYSKELLANDVKWAKQNLDVFESVYY
jgi:tetratricopeptide (TPR) repeat protein